MDSTDFLVKDYELKVRYLSDHFQRMWTRFNFFVTIESALVGSKFIFGSDALTAGVAALGLALSLVWYVFGAQDRHLVRVYRNQVQEAGRSAAAAVMGTHAAGAYQPVGEIPAKEAELRGKPTRFEWLSDWRVEAISTTRLAALFPLLLSGAWAVVLMRFLGGD